MSFETSSTSQRLAAAICENQRLRAESEQFLATLRWPDKLLQLEDVRSTEAQASDFESQPSSREAPR